MNILKNLPPWAQSLITLLLIVGGATATVWHSVATVSSPVPLAVSIIGGVCGIVGGTLGVGLIKVNARALLPLGLAGCLVVSAAGCDPMWRATRMVRDAGTMINNSLAAVHKTKRLKCKATHGAKTQGFKKCLNDSREHIAFEQWRKFGMPGLDTGLVSMVTTLTLYDRAAGKKLSWDLFVKMIKPLACGVSRAALAWKDLLGAKAAAVIAITNAIKGVTCVR